MPSPNDDQCIRISILDTQNIKNTAKYTKHQADITAYNFLGIL